MESRLGTEWHSTSFYVTARHLEVIKGNMVQY